MKVWNSIGRLSSIWKSDLSDKIKRYFLQAMAMSILLYGCTTWTQPKHIEKKLDENYIRMLPDVLNEPLKQHPPKQQLYGHLPPISQTIQVRRTRHAGHCLWHKDEFINDDLLWTLVHGRFNIGQPAKTGKYQLDVDSRWGLEDLPETMDDLDGWWERKRDRKLCAVWAIWWW